MLEKPDIDDEQLIACLRDEYGLMVASILFLPLGADTDSSVYRAVTGDGTSYFVKLRKGRFSVASVDVPHFLSGSGFRQVIPPLETRTGRLWANLASFKVILYPFVEGEPALEKGMSKAQWIEFGAVLKQFHATNFSAAITNNLQKDTFSPEWRNQLRMFLESVESQTYDSIGGDATDFLKSKKDEILEIINRAGRLAQILSEQRPALIVCHSDLHGYNLLVDQHGVLYIIDWDGLIKAPKERDLMFIGGGHGDSGYLPQEEEQMFYQGYGPTDINQTALAYYRYERIILDLVDDCYLIFLSPEGEESRKAALEDLKNKFLPDCYIAIARQTDRAPM